MTDILQQQLSAFIDGELAESEAQLLLRQLGSDPALMERARNYQRIGSVLRNEPGVERGFAKSIRERVGEIELDAAESPGAPGSSWRRLAAGAAIAATVALVALVGLNFSINKDDGAPAPLTAGIDKASGSEEGYTVPSPDTAMPVVQGQIEPKLVTYMLRHGRIAPVISGPQLRESERAAIEEAREDAKLDNQER